MVTSLEEWPMLIYKVTLIIPRRGVDISCTKGAELPCWVKNPFSMVQIVQYVHLQCTWRCHLVNIGGQHATWPLQGYQGLHQGFHGLLHHTRGSIAYQGTYKVIIIIYELHDPNKGCKVITPSSVGPRASSRLLQQARGFIGFFNHLNHTRRPSRVKIHHGIICGVAVSSHGVLWYHQSMTDQIMGH